MTNYTCPYKFSRFAVRLLLTTVFITLTATGAHAETEGSYTLGAGVIAAPEFLGSDDIEFKPVPLINIKYGHFFANVGDGVGANIIQTPELTAGVAASWMSGYDDKDMPRGIDELDGSVGGTVFVSTSVLGAVAKLSATQAITESDQGLLVDASVNYPIPATERLTIIPGVSTTWANNQHMNGYFGVNSGEAAASGLSYYKPSSGIRDISAQVQARYHITEKITAMGSVGVTRLVGDASDSPLVEEKTAPKAMVGVAYTF